MAPGQEANGDNLGQSFRTYTVIDEVILMSKHNIQFHDKIRKIP